MKLNDKTYDILCWIGRIVMPSLAVLYTTLEYITDDTYRNVDRDYTLPEKYQIVVSLVSYHKL